MFENVFYFSPLPAPKEALAQTARVLGCDCDDFTYHAGVEIMTDASSPRMENRLGVVEEVGGG